MICPTKCVFFFFLPSITPSYISLNCRHSTLLKLDAYSEIPWYDTYLCGQGTNSSLTVVTSYVQYVQ